MQKVAIEQTPKLAKLIYLICWLGIPFCIVVMILDKDFGDAAKALAPLGIVCFLALYFVTRAVVWWFRG